MTPRQASARPDAAARQNDLPAKTRSPIGAALEAHAAVPIMDLLALIHIEC